MKLVAALFGVGIVAGTLNGATAEPESGERPPRLGGVAITVTDLDKATAYYKLIGLLEEQRLGDAPKRTQYMNIDAAKATFENTGLVLSEAPEDSGVTLGNAYNVIILLVKDAKATCQRLADAKMPCFKDAHPEGPSKVISAFARDPDGRVVEFLEAKR